MFNYLLKQLICSKNIMLMMHILAVMIGLNISNIYADEAHPDIEAKTIAGETVILHASGKWEFVNPQKAAIAKEIAIKLDPTANCPPGSQGMFLGLGHCILPGDKDYLIGSRSGKGFGH